MKKRIPTSEEWALWKNLEYYPYPQFMCHCGCEKPIKIYSHHKWYGIPFVIKGHKTQYRGKSTIKKMETRTCSCGCGKIKKVKTTSTWSHFRGHNGKEPNSLYMENKNKEYYPNRFCLCGCGERIKVQKHHKYGRIPKYIAGHHSKVKNPNYKYSPLPKSIEDALYGALQIKNKNAFETLLKNRIIDNWDVFFILGLLHGYPKSQMGKIVGVDWGFVVYRIKRFNRMVGTDISYYDRTNRKGNLNHPTPLHLPTKHGKDWTDWWIEALLKKF